MPEWVLQVGAGLVLKDLEGVYYIVRGALITRAYTQKCELNAVLHHKHFR